MEAFLQALLPRILRDCTFKVHAHRGKPDLLAKLPGRLRAYSQWLPGSHRIFVVIDRDADDCAALKEALEATAALAGWRRARPPGPMAGSSATALPSRNWRRGSSATGMPSARPTPGFRGRFLTSKDCATPTGFPAERGRHSSARCNVTDTSRRDCARSRRHGGSEQAWIRSGRPRVASGASMQPSSRRRLDCLQPSAGPSTGIASAVPTSPVPCPPSCARRAFSRRRRDRNVLSPSGPTANRMPHCCQRTRHCAAVSDTALSRLDPARVDVGGGVGRHTPANQGPVWTRDISGSWKAPPRLDNRRSQAIAHRPPANARPPLAPAPCGVIVLSP